MTGSWSGGPVGEPQPLRACTATVSLADGRTLECHWWEHPEHGAFAGFEGEPYDHTLGGPAGTYWRVDGDEVHMLQVRSRERTTVAVAP